jgi:hypothetical protein
MAILPIDNCEPFFSVSVAYSLLTKASTVKNSKHFIQTRIKEFVLPPFRDGLILGKNAPIGSKAMCLALELLVATPFEHIEISDDEIIQDIIVRRNLLKRISKDKLLVFVLKNIKPLMGDEEILYLELDIEVNLEYEL